MVNLKKISVNKNLSINGVWKNYVFDPSDTDVLVCKIAMFPNPAYSQEIQNLMAPLLKEHRNADVESAITNELQAKAIAKTVLLDWKNAQDENGNEIEYTPEVGYAVLMNEDYAHFYNWVIRVAMNLANYRNDVIKESEGNL